MATISLYADKVSQMAGLIKDIKTSVTDYKLEFLELKTKSLAINKSICDLDDVIDSIQASSKTQDAKIDSLDTIGKNIEQFISDTALIDSNVADIAKGARTRFSRGTTT